MLANLNNAVEKLKTICSNEGTIKIITHLDSDGLSAGAIISQLLQKQDQQFWLSAVKQLENSLLEELEKQIMERKWKALIFLDLGSNKLNKIKQLAKYTTVFIIDHHEIELIVENSENNFDNFYFIHSDETSAACLTYFFAKLFDEDKTTAPLAIIGMIGDLADKITRESKIVFIDAKESGMQIKRSLTVFSATRPLHKALEFSSMFIHGVTGYANGALTMLREAGIEVKTSKGWRTLLDLSEEELSRLITAILVKRAGHDKNQDIIDNVYLIKIENQFWDAREISTMCNACGRLGYAGLAIAFLIGSTRAREELKMIYNQYKHHLVRALNYVESLEKIEAENYSIINAKSNIKDTMIGTVISILASSFLYPENTILVGMAYRQDDKIKVSARLVGKNKEINLNQLLSSVVKEVGGEYGGHARAAGCLIEKSKEQEFLEILEKKLSVQEIKILA